MAVCRAAQENGACKLCKYINWNNKAMIDGCQSCCRGALLPGKVPSYQRRLHTKFDENRVNCFQDTVDLFIYVYFIIVHTHKLSIVVHVYVSMLSISNVVY